MGFLWLGWLGITSLCYYVIFPENTFCISENCFQAALSFNIETERPAMPHKRAKKSVREQ
jgi:hypothetical protein